MQALQYYHWVLKPSLHKIPSTVLVSFLLSSPASAMNLESEPISPIQPETRLNLDKVTLGKALFHDVRLSSDNTISCASCHLLSSGGADRSSFSLGVADAVGTANTPTVYNSSLNFVQFWNGRAATLVEQANGPVHNPVEMNSNWPEIISRLKLDADMKKQFTDIYSDSITAANIRDAIVEFERSLLTTDAPFDRWLKGDDSALTDEEKQGYRLFKSYGCISCHQGKNVGGNMYAYFGAVKDISEYFEDRGTPISDTDLGRFSETKNPVDRYLFKVPSLRLASQTPPYFHDGSVSELVNAIKIMGRFQLGRDIPAEHITSISAFIHSLAGKHPELKK